MAAPLQQAEQLWRFLDDLAARDPEAYKNFIKKQRVCSAAAAAAAARKLTSACA
jgi:hypothetical protein